MPEEAWSTGGGRILKSSLDTLTTLATEICIVLSEYDALEDPDDELSNLEFAQANSLFLWIVSAMRLVHALALSAYSATGVHFFRRSGIGKISSCLGCGPS